MTRSIVPSTYSTIGPRISILDVLPMTSPTAIPPARLTWTSLSTRSNQPSLAGAVGKQMDADAMSSTYRPTGPTKRPIIGDRPIAGGPHDVTPLDGTS